MKTTVCIQIGNSDNKLSQEEWSEFCNRLRESVNKMNGSQIHFDGGSPSDAKWQNHCVVAEIYKQHLDSFLEEIIRTASYFNQQSIAVLEGETFFYGPSMDY